MLKTAVTDLKEFQLFEQRLFVREVSLSPQYSILILWRSNPGQQSEPTSTQWENNWENKIVFKLFESPSAYKVFESQYWNT